MYGMFDAGERTVCFRTRESMDAVLGFIRTELKTGCSLMDGTEESGVEAHFLLLDTAEQFERLAAFIDGRKDAF